MLEGMSAPAMQRRYLLGAIPLLIAAPTIVRIISLMPIKPIPWDGKIFLSPAAYSKLADSLTNLFVKNLSNAETNKFFGTIANCEIFPDENKKFSLSEPTTISSLLVYHEQMLS